RQRVEGRRAAELRMLALESLEDADGAIGVRHPFAVLLDHLKLAGRRIIEGEDDGRRAAGSGDVAIEKVVEGYQPVAALPEALEVAAEVCGGTGPALLGLIHLVILEDHHAPELVRLKRPGRGPRGNERCGSMHCGSEIG